MVLSVRLAMIAFVLALLGAFGIAAAQVSRTAPAASVWRGAYMCAQGETNLILTIESAGGSNVIAVFAFAAPDGARGSFQLSGRLASDGRLQLAPSRWINRPPGYDMVGLTGRLNGDTLSGRIDNPACGAFSVRREGSQSVARDDQTTDTFSLRDVVEIRNFNTIMDQGCSAPGDYERLKQRIRSTATSATARANSLVAPQRNTFHVTTTDITIYETYYPNACTRAARMRQCAEAQNLTAEEACDCVAGYVGATAFGAGAGEVIAASTPARRVGEQACSVAVSRATGLTQARYRAQLGRMQLYAGGGTRTGALTLQRSVQDGFDRAHIDIARGYLRDIEFGGAGPADQRRLYAFALDSLAVARRAGARETDAVVCSFAQLRDVRGFNWDVWQSWNGRLNDDGLAPLSPRPSC